VVQRVGCSASSQSPPFFPFAPPTNIPDPFASSTPVLFPLLCLFEWTWPSLALQRLARPCPLSQLVICPCSEVRRERPGVTLPIVCLSPRSLSLRFLHSWRVLPISGGPCLCGSPHRQFFLKTRVAVFSLPKLTSCAQIVVSCFFFEPPTEWLFLVLIDSFLPLGFWSHPTFFPRCPLFSRRLFGERALKVNVFPYHGSSPPPHNLRSRIYPHPLLYPLRTVSLASPGRFVVPTQVTPEPPQVSEFFPSLFPPPKLFFFSLYLSRIYFRFPDRSHPTSQVIEASMPPSFSFFLFFSGCLHSRV